MQNRHFAASGIDLRTAQQIRGYPAPGSQPRPLREASGDAQRQNVGNKRSLCGLCQDTSHNTESCPRLAEASVALKKAKSAEANVTTNGSSPEPGEVKSL